MDPDDLSGNSHKQDSFWPQLALAAAAIIVGVAGGSTGLVWVVYLGAGVLAIALAQIIVRSKFGALVKNKWYRYRDRQQLHAIADEYIILVTAVKRSLELKNQIDSLPWPHGKRPEPSADGSIHFWVIEEFYHSMPKNELVILINRFVFTTINQTTTYLNVCDQRLRSGVVRYKDEQEQSKISRLWREFERAIQEHKRFCEEECRNLKTVRLLWPVLPDLHFVWEKSKPINVEAGTNE